jgi:hypothetical protein
MKTFLTAIFVILSNFSSFSQNENAQEYNVFFNMKLEPVMQCVISQYDIKASNTVTTLLCFCDKIIRLKPGIHRLKITVDETKCSVILIEENDGADIDLTAESKRVVKNGLEEIVYIDGIETVVRVVDYVEYTFCDYFLMIR